MSSFPVDVSTIGLRELVDLKFYKIPAGAYSSEKNDCANDFAVRKGVQLAAYALVLEAYTSSSELSFLHGEISPSSERNCSLQQCTIELEPEMPIAKIVERATSGLHPAPRDLLQVPSLMLCLEEVDKLPPDLGLKAGLVLAYSPTNDLCIHYDPSIMTRPSAQRVLSQFSYLREQITSQDGLLCDLRKLSEEDATQLREWNSFPQKKVNSTIPDCIAAWLARRPDQIAVYAWDGELSRAKLHESSEQIAQFLIGKGCARGQHVAVLVQKSMWVPVVLLAILKTGAAFVLLDQTLPLKRLETMISLVSCSYAVASKENTSLATQLVENVIAIEHGKPLVVKSEHRPQKPSSTNASPEDIAFFNFTSGSSGVPKAVATQHFAWCSGYNLNAFSLAEEDTHCLHRASNNFIVSIIELLVPLMNGGTVKIPHIEELTNDLSNAIHRSAPTWVSVAPSLAKHLDPSKLSSVETLVLVGEPSPVALQKRFLQSSISRIENGFGSTEGCSYTSMHPISPSELSSQNIGKAIGRRYWVVDPADHNKLAPVGAIGELLLEGYSIGKEYWKSPEKTAQAFIASPAWAPEFDAGLDGRRWYKTGDLVKYNDSGDLLLLGRKDFQVKLFGQRIEPAEVENRLVESFSEEIQDTIVDVIYMARDLEKPRLTAFAILRKPEHTKDYVEDLQRRISSSLGQVLPSFMVPTNIVAIKAFPKTASGKIDRRALQEIGQESSLSKPAKESEDHEPTTNNEQFLKLRKVWAEVLKMSDDEISGDSNWSSLGGDSVNAISLLQKAREAGFTLKIADVLECRNMGQLLQRIEPSTTDADAQNLGVSSRAIEGPLYDTTSFQKYCSSVAAGVHGSLIYQYRISIRGRVDINTLKGAVASLFHQYDALRLEFNLDSTKQIARPASDSQVEQRLRVVHCSDADEEIDRLLSMPPTTSDEPVRWILVASPDKARMLARFHHAVIDGTSMELIFRALQTAYEDPSPVPRPQFLPYLEQRLLTQTPESIAYWRSLLAGSKPSMLRKSGKELADHDGDIADISAKRIVVLPTTNGATMSTVIKAAWAIMLAGMTAQDDVVFRYLVSGRDADIPGSLEVVGCCVTEIPIRVQASSSVKVSRILEQVQSQILASLPHAHLGADTIARKCAEWGSEITYRHSSFVLHQSVDPVEHFTLGEEAYVDVQTIVTQDTMDDFYVTSSALGGGAMEFTVEASQRWYSEKELDLVADGLVRIVQILSTEPETRLGVLMEGSSFVEI